MAKYRAKPKGHDSGQAITTKSPYGSHADMVVELEELQSSDFFETGEGRWRVIEDYETVCKDDEGYYITLKSRIDNGLADPNRYFKR
tara:strand:- start:75 stop:335 length:261 start_codon:yes stop_codon:yes gene_type:complete